MPSDNLPVVHKFGRFVFVGGICTAIQYLLLVIFVEGPGLAVTLASTLGYLMSSAANYFLNYRFTFNSSSLHRVALPRFSLIVSAGLLLNAAVTFAAANI